jgi:hypothetical protein
MMTIVGVLAGGAPLLVVVCVASVLSTLRVLKLDPALTLRHK